MEIHMKKWSKRKLGILIFCICFVLSYVGGIRYLYNSLEYVEGQGVDSTKRQVALITKSTESAFWKSVFAGANASATEYNIQLTIHGPESEEDYEAQNEMLRMAADQGAEVIIFSAVDYNGNADTINELIAQGIQVIIIDSDVNSEFVSCRIGTDNYVAGQMAGEAALESTEEELYIGIVNFDVNSENGQAREAGFLDIVSEDSRVQEIHTINVISTTEDAMTGTKELLEEYPNINVIATFNEWTSLGVGYAIKEFRLGEEIRVVAFDSNVVSVGMLETGEVDALIVQNPYAMGYLGVEYAYYLLNDSSITEEDIDTSTTLVTRDNMFEESYQKVLFAFDE